MEVSNGRRSSVAPYTHVPHSIDGHSAHSAVTPRRPLVIPPIGSQANHSQQHSVNTQESDASPHHENNVPDMNNARRKSVARPSLPGIKPAALLGNYHALKVLGVGSYGKVKLAIHMPTRLKVAIKTIDKTLLPVGYSHQSLHREAHIMGLLNHPNICKLFEVLETKTTLHMVLEYAPGGDLLDHIVSKGHLREDNARAVATQLASALAHCHSRNVSHRDLKAENILLNGNGDIKITDFGLSNVFKTDEMMTTFCGSPVYSAPEIIEGKPYDGAQVDCWSFGINLFAICVGDLPFADSNISALYQAICKGEYQVPHFISPSCKNLISKLIVVDPKKRISMADVCDHSWLNGGINFMDGSPTKTDSNHQIDQEIIAQMEDLGMNKADALNSIGKNCFDSLHGTYLILAYKKDNGIVIHEDINQPLSEVEDEVDETSDALANLLIGLERHKGAGTIESNTSITPLVKRRPTNRGKTEELKKEVVTLPQIAARNAAKAHQSNESGIDIGGAKFEIDVALYLPKDQDLPLEPENSRGPRTIRMAFNCVSISTLAPELFFQKVRSALELNEIEWVVDSYFFIGDWGDDLKFELEICKLPKLKSYGLRFKRLTGDMWEYKKLVAKITAQLQSPDQ